MNIENYILLYIQKQPTSYFCQKGVLFFRSNFFNSFYRTLTKFPGGLKIKRTAQVNEGDSKIVNIFCQRTPFPGGTTKYYKNSSNYSGIKNTSKIYCAILRTGRIFQEKEHHEKILRYIRKNSFDFPGRPFSNFHKNTYDFSGEHNPKNSYFK